MPVANTVTSPDFLAKSPLEKAEARGGLLRTVLEERPDIAQLFVSTDAPGRQRIADLWRKKLQADFPDSFKTGGYVFTENETFKGNFDPLDTDVPVLDSETEAVLAALGPVAEVRNGKTYMTANPRAGEFLNAIEDPVHRRQVGTLMRMRYGAIAPQGAEVTPDITMKANWRRVGGIHDYPVLIPNAVRIAGMLGGTTAGVLATTATGPGAVVGGSVGGGAGALAVEPLAQYLEKEVFGAREAYSAVDAAVNTAIGALPAAPLKAAGPLLRIGARGAEGGAAGAGIYSVQTALDPDSEFSWSALAQHTGLGFALGAGLGTAEAKFLAGKLGVPSGRLQGVALLQVADEVAVANRMTREESLQFIRESVDIGPPALRRAGPSTSLRAGRSQPRRIGVNEMPPSFAKATEGRPAATDRLRLTGPQSGPDAPVGMPPARIEPPAPPVRAAEAAVDFAGSPNVLPAGLTIVDGPGGAFFVVDAQSQIVGRATSREGAAKIARLRGTAAAEASETTPLSDFLGYQALEARTAAQPTDEARNALTLATGAEREGYKNRHFAGQNPTDPRLATGETAGIPAETAVPEGAAGAVPAQATEPAPTDWQETTRGRSIYKSDVAVENAKDEAVIRAMKGSPSYQKLLAAYHRFERGLRGKAYDPTVIERQPWGMLAVSSGVMNVKSQTFKTLAALENAVFKESRLPREGGIVGFRGGKGLDWDRVPPADKPWSPDDPAGEAVAAPEKSLLPRRIEGAAADSAPRTPQSAFASRTGAIDPRLLTYGGAAAARAGVGGAIGFAQGDTPEDRLGLALTYALAGAALSPAGIRKLGRFASTSNPLGRAIHPEATIGRELMRELQLGASAKAALVHRSSRILRRMDLGLASLGGEATAARGQVLQYLKGELAGAQLPTALRGPAVEMRIMIDSLSDRIVQSGMVDGPLRDTIIANQGAYMRRSFRVFGEPGWRPAPGVYDNFVAQAQRDGMTAEQAHNLANRLLDRETAENVVMRGGSAVGKNLSSFMKRKDLDEATRALLGEITDPLPAFGETASRMIRLVENDAMQKRIREIGLRSGVFSDKAQPELGVTVEMAKAGSGSFDNFAGLWTRPQFRQAFENYTTAGDVGPIWRALTSANALAKASKTLLNPESYAPNAIGALIGVIGNGHLNPRNFVRGLGRGVVAIGDEIPFVRLAGERLLVDKRLMEREVEEMIRLGVFGESVVAGDIARSVRESFAGKSKGLSNALLLPFSAVYQGTDNTAKLIGYYGELARYRRAFPAMDAGELKRLAAGVVRATTQTYGEIPRFVKSSSVVGLMPTFINFSWEVFRNAHNIARISTQDIQRGIAEGNAALVRAGAARSAAYLTLLAAGAGAAAVSLRQAGISDAQEKALRRQVLPEWDSGSMLIWDSYDGASVSYANQSYVFPPAVAMEGMQAALRGDSADEAFKNYFWSMKEQFLGGSILIIPVAEAGVGKTMATARSAGRDIVRPQATTIESGYDRILHVAEKAYKPLIVTQTEKFLKALRDEKGIHGEVFTVGDRLTRLMGLRLSKLEVDVRLASNAAQLSGRLNDVTGRYTSTHRLNLQPDERQERYEMSERGRQRLFARTQEFVGDARVLGAGDDKVIKYFRDGGMSSEFLLGVLDGVYIPGPKEKRVTTGDLWDQIADLPTAQRQAKIREMDVASAKALWAREREIYRGITPRDKLVRNLGIDDGARVRYMRRVLEGLPTERARSQQIAEWMRTKAANPAVLHQLTRDPLKGD